MKMESALRPVVQTDSLSYALVIALELALKTYRRDALHAAGSRAHERLEVGLVRPSRFTHTTLRSGVPTTANRTHNSRTAHPK